MTIMTVSARRLALAINYAADLVGVSDLHHGKRVAVMARECGRRLGYGEATLDSLFDAGLLHDCGVSSTEAHRHLVSELDWADSSIHCRQGYELLRDFRPLAHLAPILLHHHTHWQDLQREAIDSDTALHANLIYLADRVDMLANPYYAEGLQLSHAEEIRARINRYAGEFFAPRLMRAFLDASATEAFWLTLSPEATVEYLHEMSMNGADGHLNLSELKEFAGIIAHIVDAKSSFTAEHSQGVARLARRLGQLAGLPEMQCDKLEIAGMLHDIGKLQIPDDYLEKNAKLNAGEFAVMKSHSFVTWRMLKHVEGIGEIAQWAAYHHECLDGGGYPFHLQAGEIPFEARILKVADVYQAMAQRRPYRNPTPPVEILALLRSMAKNRAVDEEIVAIVAAHLQICHAAATGSDASAL
jgi:HD-GYP domain-containing protein (c-di-GMP phosphodiesterase class II)